MTKPKGPLDGSTTPLKAQARAPKRIRSTRPFNGRYVHPVGLKAANGKITKGFTYWDGIAAHLEIHHPNNKQALKKALKMVTRSLK